MRLALAALAVAGLPLTATSTLDNPSSPTRAVIVTARTVAGARCFVADSLSGIRVRSTVAERGTATWRWHPSIWAHGIDNITVSCTRANARRSVKTFVLLQALAQISVVRNYAVHLVYWAPVGGIPADVPPTAARLEADVKASLDAGSTDNPFAIPRAYGDSLGAGDPRIASIDSTTDTDPYPPPASGYCHGVSTPCLGDPNVAREVERVARTRRWAPGNHTLVIVFTSSSVTVCSRFLTKNCTPQTEPGGYHDLTDGGYAYADIVMSARERLSAADFAVALLGHEQNEAVVDPVTTGVEIGDPCEGRVKSASINGHAYDLPALELPNATCAFRYKR